MCLSNQFYISKYKHFIKRNFSIIIPTFNSLVHLKKCVKSIIEQEYQDYEVWIIDGNSSDGTQNFCSTLPSNFNTISEKDTGIYNAMNKGIDRAIGDWLYFMGADDVLWSNDVLSTIAKQSITTEKIILGDIIMEDQLSSSNPKRRSSDFSSILWLKNSVHHQGAFYHKDLFINYRYDEKLKVLSDYKFNLKLYKAHITFTKVNKTIACCGNNGISKKYNWSLYKEEISFKVNASHLIFWPFFFKVALLKFLFKKF